MHIHFLGTGGARPTKHRQNTSLLFEFTDQAVLIDCSGTPLQAILKTDSKKMGHLIDHGMLFLHNNYSADKRGYVTEKPDGWLDLDY